MAGFSYIGQVLTQRIRGAYLRAVLRQNIAFFDNLGAGEITSRIAGDTNLIQVIFDVFYSSRLANSVCVGRNFP